MRARPTPSNAVWEEGFAFTDDDAAQIRECVRCAVLAPSGHNTQPWRFAVDGTTVELRADRARSMPVGDPQDRELTISLGCALENLLIAARQAGLAPTLEVFPDDAPDSLRVALSRDEPDESPLFDAIRERHTNRRPYDGRAIPPADLGALEALGQEPGVHVRFLTEREEIERIVDLVAQGNRIAMSETAFMDELIGWIRFSRRSIEAYRDGLTSLAVGRPAVPDWFGRLLMRRWFTPARQTRLDAKLIRGASAVMIVSSEENDERAWVAVGRAFQRILLAQTLRGIRAAHLNQNWQRPALADGLRAAVDLDGRHPQLVLRVGYAEPLPHSPRRPLADVLTTNAPALTGV